jgi:uncharacterized protein YfaS (alpha-2-macroglobulin family)
MSLLNLNSFVNDTKLSEAVKKQNRSYVKSGLVRLYKLQRHDGMFRYWPEYNQMNAFITLYVTDCLIQAKHNDFKVDSAVLKKSIKSIRKFVNNDFNGTSTDTVGFLRSYAALLLAMEKKLKRSELNALIESKQYRNNALNIMLQSTAAKLFGDNHNAKRLLTEAVLAHDANEVDYKRQYGGSFHSNHRNLAFYAWLLSLQGYKDKAYTILEKLGQLVLDDKIYGTQEKAFVLRAMTEYYRDKKTSKTISAKVIVNGKTHTLLPDKELNLTLTSKDLSIEPSSMLRYRIDVSGYTEHKTLKAAHHPSMDLYVKLQLKVGDLPAQNVNIHRGDLVQSVIHLKAKDRIENLVLVNRVPACLEIVNRRLVKSNKTQTYKNFKNFKPDYLDIRDDRELIFGTLNKGEYVWITDLRAVISGKCILPTVQAEAMYDNRIQSTYRYGKTISIK